MCKFYSVHSEVLRNEDTRNKNMDTSGSPNIKGESDQGIAESGGGQHNIVWRVYNIGMTGMVC